MADRFYVNFPLTLGEVLIQGPEVHHLATVRRFRPGDMVTLFNGNGSEYPAKIVSVGKKEVSLIVKCVDQPLREASIPLEVAAAVPKGDREEFLIEKLTELGVARFVPLITERSVVVPKIERLQRTVIEASKQCGRNVLMQIGRVTSWSDYINGSPIGERWVAHANTPQTIHSLTLPGAIAVGPEGGLTDEEVATAVAQDWRLVGLGPRTLRIETAAIALAVYFSLSAANA